MEHVKWSMEGIFKADAQKCYEEIGDKGITPEEVLEKAMDENSELHKCFEWNDTVAAHKYRLLQARSVIRMLVKVTEDKDEPPTRVLHISSETGVYQPTVYFQRNEDEYKILLNKAYAELQSFKQRYKSLSELEPVMEAIDNI